MLSGKKAGVECGPNFFQKKPSTWPPQISKSRGEGGADRGQDLEVWRD